MHKINKTLSLLIALFFLPINVYAHGFTTETLALILLVIFGPAVISIATLFVADNKKRNKKPYEIWLNTSRVFAVIQSLVILFFVVT